jgi:hypothetical protein
VSLERRKAELRRDIEALETQAQRDLARKRRYLESLENMPEFGALAEGTVLGLLVSYAGSRPYPLVAYRGGADWYLTGERAPRRVTSDELAEWLVSQGRSLKLAAVLAEFGVETVPTVDLGALLDGMFGR